MRTEHHVPPGTVDRRAREARRAPTAVGNPRACTRDRGVIYQPGYTLTKSATFPENRTTSVSRC